MSSYLCPHGFLFQACRVCNVSLTDEFDDYDDDESVLTPFTLVRNQGEVQ